jgi:ABC-type Fe3+-hydroxamate transport system substrate-binding protein
MKPPPTRAQDAIADRRSQREAVKDLIARYPDLKARVVMAFTVGPMKMASYDQWSGYIPIATYNAGGVEVPNTSPIRLALVEILDEARHRYASENHGEVPV